MPVFSRLSISGDDERSAKATKGPRLRPVHTCIDAASSWRRLINGGPPAQQKAQRGPWNPSKAVPTVAHEVDSIRQLRQSNWSQAEFAKLV